MARGLGWPFLALCTVPFVMVLSNSLLIPVLPSIRAALDTTALRTGLLITAFSVPAGLTIPLAGALSDHVGRKAVIVPALLLFGLGGLVAGAAGWLTPHPYPWLVAGRILQGIGGGGTYQIALALAGDLYRRASRARAMGFLEAANAAGKVVSPVLGGLTALVAWFAPFLVYPALSWPAAAAVAALVPEPERGRPRRASRYLRGLRDVFRRRGASLAAAFLAGGTMLFMLFGVLSWLSDVLESRFGLRDLQRALLIAVPVVVAAATSLLAGSLWLARRPAAARAAVVAGTLLVAAALAGLALARSAGQAGLTALASVLGLGYGLALTGVNTSVTGAAASEERGLVTALYGTVRFMGAAFGPPAFDVGARAGLVAAFAGAAAWTALVGLAVLRWLRPPQAGSGEPRDGRASRRPADEPIPVHAWD